MKYAVVLCDGMADYPVPELGGMTPLEVASHPAMDRLASNGLFGLTRTVPEGMQPGSDTANLAVFGYDPKVYYSGRSPLEAASIGVPLEDTDVTYRCNFVTLSGGGDSLGGAVMADYSAGEITTEEAHALVAFLNDALADENVRLYPGFSYRQCLVVKHGETGALLTQPHDIPDQPVGDKLPRGTNGQLLNRWMQTAYRLLKTHPVNLAREQAGKRPANGIWFWGEGRKPRLTPFTEKTGLRGAVVSAVDLIQGIGICAGMRVLKVEGATGTFRTNFEGKTAAAIDALQNGCDYVYVHLEAPDECGHQHQVAEKVWSIEQIDSRVLSPLVDVLEESGEDYAVLVLPDHPTPLTVRTHVADPVPFALYRRGDAAGRSLTYTEAVAAETGVFLPHAYELIDILRAQRGPEAR